MTSYLAAIAIIFLLFLGWVVVQHLARAFARRHPEFGPVREEGGGCGKSCSCSRAGQCERKSGRDAR